jgi:hypothetical protein
MTRPLIALVDPVRTSVAYLAELERRGVRYLQVESGFVGSLAGPAVVKAATLDEMAGILRGRGVTRVVGCVDPSLPYADELSALLGLPAHGIRRSEARRNKARMNEVVRAAGVNAPDQREVEDEAGLLDALLSFRWPVVLKPVASGGSDNVHLCRTADEALVAFRRILHARNLMGLLNTTVLLQEHVDGVEYMVDSVSFDEVHVPVSYFEYQKGIHNGRAFVYEKERFLRSDDPRSLRLGPFARTVLDALEVRTGPTHLEAKIDSRGELRFIEVGARLCGGDGFWLLQDVRADGRGQLEIAVDAFLGLAPPEPGYAARRGGIRVYVIAGEAGRLEGLRHVDRIEGLASFRRMQVHVQLGQAVVPTTDMSNDVGWIDLAHDDPAILDQDEQALDAILRDGILQLSTDGSP